jgi:hypothetical protein
LSAVEPLPLHQKWFEFSKTTSMAGRSCSRHHFHAVILHSEFVKPFRDACPIAGTRGLRWSCGRLLPSGDPPSPFR